MALADIVYLAACSASHIISPDCVWPCTAMGYGLFQGLTYSFSPMVYCFLSEEADLKQVCYVLQQESNLFLHVLRAYFLTMVRHFRKESKKAIERHLPRLDKIYDRNS